MHTEAKLKKSLQITIKQRAYTVSSSKSNILPRCEGATQSGGWRAETVQGGAGSEAERPQVSVWRPSSSAGQRAARLERDASALWTQRGTTGPERSEGTRQTCPYWLRTLSHWIEPNFL